MRARDWLILCLLNAVLALLAGTIGGAMGMTAAVAVLKDRGLID